MNNIVLTSCGFRNKEFKNKFYKIISKDELKNKKVLYITTAVDGENDDNKDWVAKEYKTILDLGIDESNIVEYKIGNDINIDDFDIIEIIEEIVEEPVEEVTEETVVAEEADFEG